MLIGTPEKILAVGGLIPLPLVFSRTSKWRHITAVKKALFGLAVCFILGGTFRATIIIINLILYTMQDPDGDYQSPILHSLSLICYAILPTQPVVVLSIFMFQRKNWYTVQLSLREIADFGNNYLKKQGNWKRTGNALSCTTLLIIILWEFTEWRSYYDANPQWYSPDFQEGFAPLPIKINAAQTCILWIFFCTIPTYLTQQLYICVIVNAIILRDACTVFLRKLKELKKNLSCAQGVMKVAVALKELQEFHFKLIICMEMLDKMYSWVLLAIFGFNVAMACSFITAIIALPPKVTAGIILHYGSIVIFFSYAVIFAIPLVQVYEKADQFALGLYELRLEAENQPGAHFTLKNGPSLVDVIDLLEDKTRHYVPCFTGGNLVHYTRSLLAAACTFLVSAGLLAQEVVSRTQAASSGIPASANCSLCRTAPTTLRNTTQ